MTTKITADNINATGVVAGTYTNANITVNAQGQITQASSGAAGTGSANSIVSESNITVSSSYAITSGKNGLSLGPVTIQSGVSLTVGSGQRWLILER